MSDPERCLAQAEEAERMAALVSYERDRERLLRQAAEWRSRADALARTTEEAGISGDASPTSAGWSRLLTRLSPRRRSHGG